MKEVNLVPRLSLASAWLGPNLVQRILVPIAPLAGKALSRPCRLRGAKRAVGTQEALTSV